MAREVTDILEQALIEPEPLSLLELRSLGKAVWQAGGAVAHVESERASWK